MKVTAAMKIDGALDDKALVPELDAQIVGVAKCAAIVRKSDTVVGSLNLQITVAKDGTVTPDLQSPVNKEAKSCILAAVRKWRVKKAGAGRAMVLLSVP